MGNKNQAMRSKKQARAKSRQKKVQHGAAVSRAKEKRLVSGVDRLTNTEINVSDRGVIGTAEYIKNTRKKLQGGEEGEISNVTVLEMTQKVIPELLSIHAAVEIVCELQKEGKFTLSEEQQKMIDQFDERIVKVGEDIVTMQSFIQADKGPEDYMPVFIAYLDKIALLFEKELAEVFEQILKPYEELINEYVREHSFEGETSFDFSMRYHTNRIDVVAPKYRTIAPLDIPEAEEPSEELKETTALNASPTTC